MSARIDLLLVNWHGHAEIAAALGPLRPWPHGRVHVVDNSSDAAEWKRLRAALPPGPDLNLIEAPRNLGFGGGCNLAWQSEAARGADHVLLLNPDARMSAGDVIGLSRTLDAHPRAAAVSPRTDWDRAGGFTLPLPPAQGPAAEWRAALHERMSRARPAALQRRGLQAVEHTRRVMTLDQPWPLDTVSGGVLMVRREAVDRLALRLQAPGGGLFDPRYFMYFEDTDLAARLRAAGWDLLMAPHCRALHGWRHQPHKAPLMAQAQQEYLRQHHPVAMALSRLLIRGLRGQSATDSWAWLDAATPQPLPNLETAQEALGSVLALSPSPWLQPALARCNGPARPLNAAEWDLVEPGRHAALVKRHNPGGADNHPDGASTWRWVRFDKT